MRLDPNTENIATSVMEAIILFFTFTLFLVVFMYFVRTGPLHHSQYPLHTSSPYLLPWEAGKSHLCVQSNRGIASHRGHKKFAWDFYMPEGTKILASRSGVVESVVDCNSGYGLNKVKYPNNEIFIRHDDGTLARYAHIKRGGSLVKTGDNIKQGDPIALSGDVGKSLGPHLHFEIRDRNGATIPLSFNDVGRHHGIPKMFFSYQSKNQLNSNNHLNIF